MTPERLAEILKWNQTVFESEARRDPDSLAGRIICAVQEAIETEREACAKACDSQIDHDPWDDFDKGCNVGARCCAKSIRKRNEE